MFSKHTAVELVQEGVRRLGRLCKRRPRHGEDAGTADVAARWLRAASNVTPRRRRSSAWWGRRSPRPRLLSSADATAAAGTRCGEPGSAKKSCVGTNGIASMSAYMLATLRTYGHKDQRSGRRRHGLSKSRAGAQEGFATRGAMDPAARAVSAHKSQVIKGARGSAHDSGETCAGECGNGIGRAVQSGHSLATASSTMRCGGPLHTAGRRRLLTRAGLHP